MKYNTMGSHVDILVQRLEPYIPLPTYARNGDAGADIVTRNDVVIQPGERMLVPTGISIAIPDGYAAFVHPRSGLAAKHGLSIVNAPGTIDAGYRGEIFVPLLNTDAHTPIKLAKGDRIAQLVIQKVEHAVFHEAQHLPNSDRGEHGFGSTGGFANN